MAKFEPKALDLTNINGGNRYENGDSVQAQTINDVIESTAKSQADVQNIGERIVTTESSVGSIDSKLNNIVNNTTKIDNGMAGFSAGLGSTTGAGGAIGSDAQSEEGGAIGQSASTLSGGAVGFRSNSNTGGAIGKNAKTVLGGAVGAFSESNIGFSGGYNAKTSVSDAIQLGHGTNNEQNTMQVYDHKVMGADGELYSRGEETATKTDVNNAVASKQDKLTAGENITIVDNVISSTGGGGTELTPQQIENINNVPNKQDKLIAGENITIGADGKTISATGGGGGLPEFKPEDANKVPIVNATADGFNYVPKKGVKAMSFPAPSEANNGQFLKSNGTGLEYADAGGGEAYDPNADTALLFIKNQANSNFMFFKTVAGISTITATTIPMNGKVYWGDGTYDVNNGDKYTIEHQYATSGQYLIAVTPYCHFTADTRIEEIYYTSGFNEIQSDKRFIKKMRAEIINDYKNAFSNCQYLEILDGMLKSASASVSFENAFFNCLCLKSIGQPTYLTYSNIPHFIKVTNMQNAFYGCRNLLEIPYIDVSGITIFNSTFGQCNSLVAVHLLNIKANINFSNSKFLSRAALNEIISNLVNVGEVRTLTIGATNLAKLTAEDIQIATDKGWTIA